MTTVARAASEAAPRVRHPNTWVYFDGDICRYHDVHIGLMTNALHYGTGVYDGTRAYWDGEHGQLYIAQGVEHFERMRRSAKTLEMTLPHTNEELLDITLELIRRNEFREDIYIRPILFAATEEIGCRLDNIDVSFAIYLAPANRYAAWTDGIRCKISSWRRVSDDAIPARAKATGAYINCALSKLEATASGFDEAIMLNRDGHVAEGPVENIFMVKKGGIVTPPLGDDIVEGLTRGMVLELIRDELDLPVTERSIQRTELYSCDELFFTGTGVRVTSIVDVDDRRIGDGTEGPVTKRLKELFRAAVLRRLPGREHWTVPVY